MDYIRKVSGDSAVRRVRLNDECEEKQYYEGTRGSRSIDSVQYLGMSSFPCIHIHGGCTINICGNEQRETSPFRKNYYDRRP